jgi:hypothetical protein
MYVEWEEEGSNSHWFGWFASTRRSSSRRRWSQVTVAARSRTCRGMGSFQAAAGAVAAAAAVLVQAGYTVVWDLRVVWRLGRGIWMWRSLRAWVSSSHDDPLDGFHPRHTRDSLSDIADRAEDGVSMGLWG